MPKCVFCDSPLSLKGDLDENGLPFCNCSEAVSYRLQRTSYTRKGFRQWFDPKSIVPDTGDYVIIRCIYVDNDKESDKRETLLFSALYLDDGLYTHCGFYIYVMSKTKGDNVRYSLFKLPNDSYVVAWQYDGDDSNE